MSAFTDALELAQESARALDGVTVVYRRKGGNQLSLLVSIGETRVENTTSEGDGIVHTKVRDYIISTSELRDGGRPFIPQTGDQILETIDGQVHVMVLRPLVGNGNAWRWHGTHHDAVRVHTKQIATED